MITTQEYRGRIYSQYVSRASRQLPEFDAVAARRRGRQLARVWKGWLPANRDVSMADLACGNGGVLFGMKSLGYTNLAGVDISPEQVSIARQATSRIVLGDAVEFLESRPASFDFIIGLDVIEHLQKGEVFRFLDACHASLRPGGRLVLQTPNADSCFVGAVRYGDFTHETCFSPQSLDRLLTMCGFERIEWREGGPAPVGLVSAGRWVLWQAIRTGMRVWNFAETGSSGSGAYTRVFLISGVKE